MLKNIVNKVLLAALGGLFFAASPSWAGGTIYLFAEGSRANGSSFATADLLTETKATYTFAYRQADVHGETAVYPFYWLPGMPASGNVSVTAEIRGSVSGSVCMGSYIGCETTDGTSGSIGYFGAAFVPIGITNFADVTITPVPIPPVTNKGTCWVSIHVDKNGILCASASYTGTVDFRTVKISW